MHLSPRNETSVSHYAESSRRVT